MAKKGSSSFKLWFFLVVAAAGGYFYWQYRQTGALWDQSGLCGKFEEQTDQVLTDFKVRDSDVLKVDREEKRSPWPLPLLWVETEKTVRVESKDFRALLQRLNKSAHALRIDLLNENHGEQETVLEYGRKGRVFEKFIFVIGAAGAEVGAVSASSAAATLPGEHAGQALAVVSIVIDDVSGRRSDLKKLDDFFALPIPVTYAVLPRQRNTADCVDKITEKGAEIILHQPMESEKAPKYMHGDYALWTSMSEKDIHAMLQKNLQSVKMSLGLSNHMGSRFTSDAESLKRFFAAYKSLMGKTPLFFFDSATNSKNVSGDLARAYKIPTLRNDIFLDEKDDLEAMKKQIFVLERIALRRGHASAIGHIQRKHMVQALQETIPELEKKGIKFINLSELISQHSKS